MQRVMIDVVTGEISTFPLTQQEIDALPPAPTNSDKLKEELKFLNEVYQADLTQYRLLWTSISITDGANEETRKTNIRVQWATRTAQYSSDVVAAKLKYQ